MDERIFWFGVTSRLQVVPFTCLKTTSTLPTSTGKRPRVDSVLTSKVSPAVDSDDEADSDETSEFEVLETKIVEGKSFKIDGFRYVLKSDIRRYKDGEIKTDEHWDRYECEDEGEDDEDLKVHEKPKPAKKLVDLPYEKIVITFTPSGSPTAEKDEDDSYFENAPAADITQALAPAPTPVQAMVSSLLQILATKEHDKVLRRAAEDVLINHLHTTAVTLSDIEVILPPNSWNPRRQQPITPSLALNHRVTGKLAANIGLNVSRGRISADELEAIKIHIHRNGDENDWLFNRINEQVERFKAESEAFKLSKLTDKQKKQRAHEARQALQQEEKTKRLKAFKEENELRKFLAAVPKEWHAPFPSEYSPYENMVGVFIETHGIAWDKIPKRVGRSKVWADPLGEGSFAMTRLHNGPGVNDKGKEPHVRIPKMMRKLPSREMRKDDIDEPVSAQLQTMSLSQADTSTVEARNPIVVQLPPH